MTKVLSVKCPHCKKEFNYYSSEFRPFCCERCKMVDLGLWMSESYTVPIKKTPEELEFDEFEIPQEDLNFFREDDEEH